MSHTTSDLSADLPIRLQAVFARVLGLSASELQAARSFQEMGISSINTVRVLEAINTEFDLSLPTSILFECHDLPSLHKYLHSKGVGTQSAATARQTVSTSPPAPAMNVQAALPAAADEDEEEAVAFVIGDSPLPPASSFAADAAPHAARAPAPRQEPISTVNPRPALALVGLACRSAGARDQFEFWDLIVNGKDCIRARGGNQWQAYFARQTEASVPAFGGFMDDIDHFDPLFFNISPKEAQAMDPCQRILLEESWHALEDAGINPASLSEARVAVMVGAMSNQYPSNNSHYSLLGIESSILAARLAYFLNLKGPALSVNTACSSSLVALELAAEKLWNGEVDLALAAGVTVYTNPDSYLMMSQAGMLAPDGHCKPFDDSANGIVVGDGAGVVVLKRLDDALREHDQIYAILEGIAINQDGKTSGLTVPSFLAQSQLQQHVYRKFGIHPEHIGYIETHGTGTRLGDPVEVHALTDSFRQFTQRKQFCALGALKANIGHTTAAAGVLGLIKAALALRYQTLPPSIHCQQENRHIDFANSPFYVNKEKRPWLSTAGQPRRAAVSSFGFSGTNAHLVLCEAPPAHPTAPTPFQGPFYFPLSAASRSSLQAGAARLAQFLQTQTTRVADAHGGQAPGHEEMLKQLAAKLSASLGIPGRDLAADLEFGDMGLDRYQLARWQETLPPQAGVISLHDSLASLAARLQAPPQANQGQESAWLAQIAYTLQVGRQALPVRALCCAADLRELLQQLQRVANPVQADFCPISSLSSPLPAPLKDWLQGQDLDWAQFYADARNTPVKLALPGYAFERVSCWLPGVPLPDADFAPSNLPSNAPSIAPAAAVPADQGSDAQLMQQLQAAGANLSGAQLLHALRKVLTGVAA